MLDNSIAGPLGLVTDVSLLKVSLASLLTVALCRPDICRKHHGVDKMFWLESGPLTSTTTHVVYLCRPLIRNIKIVAGESPNLHPYSYLIAPTDRPDQETPEGVSETRVHPHTDPTRFNLGQPDPGRGRRVGRGQDRFVQPSVHPARGGRGLIGERQCVQGNMGGAYPSSTGIFCHPQRDIRTAMNRAYTTPHKR